jgi:hypothetical protein
MVLPGADTISSKFLATRMVTGALLSAGTASLFTVGFSSPAANAAMSASTPAASTDGRAYFLSPEVVSCTTAAGRSAAVRPKKFMAPSLSACGRARRKERTERAG